MHSSFSLEELQPVLEWSALWTSDLPSQPHNPVPCNKSLHVFILVVLPLWLNPDWYSQDSHPHSTVWWPCAARCVRLFWNLGGLCCEMRSFLFLKSLLWLSLLFLQINTWLVSGCHLGCMHVWRGASSGNPAMPWCYVTLELFCGAMLRWWVQVVLDL